MVLSADLSKIRQLARIRPITHIYHATVSAANTTLFTSSSTRTPTGIIHFSSVQVSKTYQSDRKCKGHLYNPEK